MPLQDAVDEFGIADDIECFFLDEPTNDALVHRGDLVVPGPLAVDGEDIQLHVVDGSLLVKDAFSFQNVDVYAALCVTGSVSAKSMACIWDIQFVIGGSVDVDDVLVTQLTDAGWFAVRGGLTAGSWLQMDDRGILAVDGPVSALRYSPEDGQAAVREEYLFDVELIRDGLLAGRPVLH